MASRLPPAGPFSSVALEGTRTGAGAFPRGADATTGPGTPRSAARPGTAGAHRRPIVLRPEKTLLRSARTSSPPPPPSEWSLPAPVQRPSEEPIRGKREGPTPRGEAKSGTRFSPGAEPAGDERAGPPIGRGGRRREPMGAEGAGLSSSGAGAGKAGPGAAAPARGEEVGTSSCPCGGGGAWGGSGGGRQDAGGGRAAVSGGSRASRPRGEAGPGRLRRPKGLEAESGRPGPGLRTAGRPRGRMSQEEILRKFIKRVQAMKDTDHNGEDNFASDFMVRGGGGAGGAGRGSGPYRLPRSERASRAARALCGHGVPRAARGGALGSLPGRICPPSPPRGCGKRQREPPLLPPPFFQQIKGTASCVWGGSASAFGAAALRVRGGGFALPPLHWPRCRPRSCAGCSRGDIHPPSHPPLPSPTGSVPFFPAELGVCRGKPSGVAPSPARSARAVKGLLKGWRRSPPARAANRGADTSQHCSNNAKTHRDPSRR